MAAKHLGALSLNSHWIASRRRWRYLALCALSAPAQFGLLASQTAHSISIVAFRVLRACALAKLAARKLVQQIKHVARSVTHGENRLRRSRVFAHRAQYQASILAHAAHRSSLTHLLHHARRTWRGQIDSMLVTMSRHDKRRGVSAFNIDSGDVDEPANHRTWRRASSLDGIVTT